MERGGKAEEETEGRRKAERKEEEANPREGKEGEE